MSTEAINIKRRSVPGELRYLAAKLHEGVSPHLVALALEVLADEMTDGESIEPRRRS